MTTLIDVLKDERNTAVIFAHIHRRQRELFDALGTGDIPCIRSIDYRKADREMLLDILTIREFYEQLTDHDPLMTRDELKARCESKCLLAEECTRYDLVIDVYSDRLEAVYLGVDLAWQCKFGIPQGAVELYESINPRTARLDEPEEREAA